MGIRMERVEGRAEERDGKARGVKGRRERKRGKGSGGVEMKGINGGLGGKNGDRKRCGEKGRAKEEEEGMRRCGFKKLTKHMGF